MEQHVQASTECGALPSFTDCLQASLSKGYQATLETPNLVINYGLLLGRSRWQWSRHAGGLLIATLICLFNETM